MKRILIVDDEKNIRLTLKQSLFTEHYEVDIAINGEEALDKIKHINYDLVLLDIKMPGLSGMEVLTQLRHFNNKLHVIMMTAYGTIEQAVEAMKLGAIDFISKPFTPNEIKETVGQVFYREILDQNELVSYQNIINYAKKCILDKNYEKAMEYLNKAISINMNEAEPHNLLGNIFEVKSRFDDALNEYRKSLEKNPNYEQAQNNKNRLLDFMNFMNKNKEDHNEE